MEEAARREIREETGLRTASLLRKLAVEEKPHPETGQPRRTTLFHLEVPSNTPDTWLHRVQGDDSDAGLTFACRFLTVPLAQRLADDQGIWLDRIDSTWRTQTEPQR
ncbi:NUDIX domain-containing protein [Streptomyces sp. NPDC006333]|uniref:NUDIX domain-containing protein n=1 Tax=Streptomyces sp. NPDC006333 TaxID=3156753 RepID=UPI0033ADBB3E